MPLHLILILSMGGRTLAPQSGIVDSGVDSLREKRRGGEVGVVPLEDAVD